MRMCVLTTQILGHLINKIGDSEIPPDSSKCVLFLFSRIQNNMFNQSVCMYEKCALYVYVSSESIGNGREYSRTLQSFYLRNAIKTFQRFTLSQNDDHKENVRFILNIGILLSFSFLYFVISFVFGLGRSGVLFFFKFNIHHISYVNCISEI